MPRRELTPEERIELTLFVAGSWAFYCLANHYHDLTVRVQQLEQRVEAGK